MTIIAMFIILFCTKKIKLFQTNEQGIQLVNELIDHYSLDVVQAYMGHIQANAEVAVRDMLKLIGSEAQMRQSCNEDLRRFWRSTQQNIY